MFHIIYPYRDRDLKRVKKSLDSLTGQTSNDFHVVVADYGSRPEKAKAVQGLVGAYDFAEYRYFHTRHQPWNKSRALNAVLKTFDEGWFFVADVDMIFHSKFIEKAIALQETDKSVYFQVAFTSEGDKIADISEKTFQKYRKSTEEATGLSMFPVEVLKKLHGFDEFYHFWGAEDTDMHVRLKNAGYKVEFFDEQILLLHQWHKSYRASEKPRLSTAFQVQGIVQLNHQYLKMGIQQKRTVVNKNSWGSVLSEADYVELENRTVNLELSNEKQEIEAFLFGQLPGLNNEILKLRIKESSFPESYKYQLKKILGKKVSEYYSLKEVNDKLLLHIISFYRDKPYTYKIGKDLKSIEFAIKL
jgi:choline kinase